MNNWLLEVSEDDSFTLVYQYVANVLDSGESEEDTKNETPGTSFLSLFESSLKENRTTEEQQLSEEAITKLLTVFIDHIPRLFEKGSDADVESCIQLMNHHLYSKLPPEETNKFSTSLASAIASSQASKAETRLACLMHLYNASVSTEEQYSVLMKAIEFAIGANLAHVLSPVVKGNAESLVANWNLSPVASSKLYLSIASLVRKSREKDAHSQSIALTSKALAFIDASDTSACKQVAEEAAEAVADFLKAKDLFASDLSELAPVKALAKNPKHLYLHQLFNVVARGLSDQLDSVCKPELLEQLKITRAQCLEKTRMAALLSLARTFFNKTIPFKEISIALKIDHSDVEQWIVKASGAKLMTARIDQYSKTVSVIKCAPKGFDGSEWKRIRDQLLAWKDVLKEVEKLVADSQQESDGLHSTLRV